MFIKLNEIITTILSCLTDASYLKTVPTPDNSIFYDIPQKEKTTIKNFVF